MKKTFMKIFFVLCTIMAVMCFHKQPVSAGFDEVPYEEIDIDLLFGLGDDFIRLAK